MLHMCAADFQTSYYKLEHVMFKVGILISVQVVRNAMRSRPNEMKELIGAFFSGKDPALSPLRPRFDSRSGKQMLFCLMFVGRN